MARAAPAAAVAALAALSWLLAGHGLPNYDTLYTLVWGRDVWHLELPDYEVPLAPTPHPLATLGAAFLGPLLDLSSGGLHGEAATTVVVALAFVALGLLGWVTYALGAAWLHPAVGVLAAAILLTRRPVLDFGARAYIDIPYLVLVLGAVLVETRRPRAGVPVLLLLGLAGLLRPEAWLFAGAYALWLRELRLLALAAAAPLLWALTDLLVTGNPLHSLTGTRENAATLERITGLDDVPLTVPRRLGEILREPVLLGAAGGGLLALAWLRERRGIRLGAVTGVVSLGAFCVLAAAGLPILGRYLLLPAAILAIFGAAGALGWLALPPGDPRRRPWQAFGAVVALALLVFLPAQADRLGALRRALDRQEAIQGDLAQVARAGGLTGPVGCRPVAVPNRRPVPLLALWLGAPADAIAPAQDRVPARGAYLVPASPQVARDYILDPRDLDRTIPAPPAAFSPRAANRSWRLLTHRCE
jgi:hypothetical protein